MAANRLDFIFSMYIKKRKTAYAAISAITPKYCRHYRYFFLVIIVNELKYAALTLMNIKKGFHSVTKKNKSDKELKVSFRLSEIIRLK